MLVISRIQIGIKYQYLPLTEPLNKYEMKQENALLVDEFVDSRITP
jgi:hypothetical protein